MFTINNGGINTKHSMPFLMSRPGGSEDYVLLIIKTHADFIIDNAAFKICPDTALLIRPHIPYQYSSEQEYSDDWLHFEFSQEDVRWIKDLPFHYPIPLSTTSRYTQYIQEILWENNYASADYSFSNADLLFKVLLNNLRHAYTEKEAAGTYSPYRIRLQNLRLTMQAQPWEKYSIQKIADSLGISVSYFQHQYTALFHISFQADLISLRIAYAKDLIVNTDLSMEKIAEMSGYTNEVHFYRQFKKYTGMTPAAWRRR